MGGPHKDGNGEEFQHRKLAQDWPLLYNLQNIKQHDKPADRRVFLFSLILRYWDAFITLKYRH